MSPQQIVRRLWDLGHFNNPAHQTGVTEADLPNLKLTDKAVRIAMASYQEFMAVDFDRFSAVHHNRPGICDGDIGPASIDLLTMERCGYPDYEMATAEEAGTGSWPVGCHPEYPNNHAFAVFFDFANMPSHWKPAFEQAWELVVQAYADIGLVVFRTTNRKKANTIVTWQRGAGWIGLAIVPRGPQCGDTIWAKYDTSYGIGFALAKLINQLAALLGHEKGHNMGLSHSRGGVMNPSINSAVFTPTMWRGDPSEPILKRWFGGVPVDIGGPKPPPDPDPNPDPDPKPDDPKPPTPGKVYFTGSVNAMVDGVSIGEFILSPKPRL